MLTLPEAGIYEVFLVCSSHEVPHFFCEKSFGPPSLCFLPGSISCAMNTLMAFLYLVFCIMSKVLSTYCFCGGFQRRRCWWNRWVTLYLSLSCSLMNSLSWRRCWGKQPHPAPHHSSLFSPPQWQISCLGQFYIITCWAVLGNWCYRKTIWQSSCSFSVTSVSSWILPCTCRNRKDRKAGKHSYLWGSRRVQECSWFIPVEAI